MGAALVLVLIGLGGLAVGLLVGRYYVPDDRQLRRSARHGRAYLRALAEALARDSEAALAELRKVVEENVDDPEPYFAMAALFRSRGEHERAIRVHQALALRERDRKKLKLRALYELGLDFRAAGMPRRATRAMEEVLEDEPAHEGALRAAAGLYEEQGRWGDAAAMWRRLAKHRGEPSSPREHHLRIAAAQAAIGREDLDSARQWLKEARALPEGESPHFLVAAAELAAARGNPAGARDRLRQALRAAPRLVTYLWPPLLSAERTLAAERGLSDEERGRDELEDGEREPAGAGDAGRAGPGAAGRAPALVAGASLALPASGEPASPEAAAAPGVASASQGLASASRVLSSASQGLASAAESFASASQGVASASPSAPSAGGSPEEGASSFAIAREAAGAASVAAAPATTAVVPAASPAPMPSALAASTPGTTVVVPATSPTPSALAAATPATTAVVPAASPTPSALATLAPTPATTAVVTTAPPPSTPSLPFVSVFPPPPAPPAAEDSAAASAARHRVDAFLRELAAATGQRLELVLARAALAQAAPNLSAPPILAAIAESYPASVAAQLAAARLELARDRRDPERLAAALAALTAERGPLAWALDGRWRCTACARTSPQFAWRCEGCRRWATLELETGAPEPPRPEPRERRAERRRADGSHAPQRDASDGSAGLGSGGASSFRFSALPAPSLDSGMSEADLAARERKRSLLGRAGRWFSGVWSGSKGPSAR